MECGLIGKTLTHSFSKQIHGYLAGYDYRYCECESEQAVAELLRSRAFLGLNVTVPYKQAVMPYLDEISSQAERIGSVNTVCNRNGKLIGYNTDYDGFVYLLRRNGIGVAGKAVAVLGNGGAAQAVRVAMEDEGANVYVVSRKGALNYENLQHVSQKIQVLVNTTPVGMYPDTENFPVDLGSFPKVECVVDLIYNPRKTKLLLQAEAKGLSAVNGLSMLVAQAKKASELFLQKQLPDSVIDGITKDIFRQATNLIFVGMPGCGKTAVGKEVARRLARPFVDTDEEFAKVYGLAAGQAVAQWGEHAFRLKEAEVVHASCKQRGAVIALGGGSVLRPDNREAIRSNGVVCYLTKELSGLDTKDRPLSVDLPNLFYEREPIYRQIADFTVSNDGDLTQAVSDVIRQFQENAEEL